VLQSFIAENYKFNRFIQTVLVCSSALGDTGCVHMVFC